MQYCGHNTIPLTIWVNPKELKRPHFRRPNIALKLDLLLPFDFF